jgi:hypothetical protein
MPLDGPSRGAFFHPFFVRGNKSMIVHMSRHSKPNVSEQYVSLLKGESELKKKEKMVSNWTKSAVDMVQQVSPLPIVDATFPKASKGNGDSMFSDVDDIIFGTKDGHDDDFPGLSSLIFGDDTKVSSSFTEAPLWSLQPDRATRQEDTLEEIEALDPALLPDNQSIEEASDLLFDNIDVNLLEPRPVLPSSFRKSISNHQGNVNPGKLNNADLFGSLSAYIQNR